MNKVILSPLNSKVEELLNQCSHTNSRKRYIAIKGLEYVGFLNSEEMDILHSLLWRFERHLGKQKNLSPKLQNIAMASLQKLIGDQDVNTRVDATLALERINYLSKLESETLAYLISFMAIHKHSRTKMFWNNFALGVRGIILTDKVFELTKICVARLKQWKDPVLYKNGIRTLVFLEDLAVRDIFHQPIKIEDFIDKALESFINRFTVTFEIIEDTPGKKSIRYNLINEQNEIFSEDVNIAYYPKHGVLNIPSFHPQIYIQYDAEKGHSAACFYLVMHHFFNYFNIGVNQKISLDSKYDVFKNFYQKLADFCFTSKGPSPYLEGYMQSEGQLPTRDSHSYAVVPENKVVTNKSN